MSLTGWLRRFLLFGRGWKGWVGIVFQYLLALAIMLWAGQLFGMSWIIIAIYGLLPIIIIDLIAAAVITMVIHFGLAFTPQEKAILITLGELDHASAYDALRVQANAKLSRAFTQREFADTICRLEVGRQIEHGDMIADRSSWKLRV